VVLRINIVVFLRLVMEGGGEEEEEEEEETREPRR